MKKTEIYVLFRYPVYGCIEGEIEGVFYDRESVDNAFIDKINAVFQPEQILGTYDDAIDYQQEHSDAVFYVYTICDTMI